MSIAYPEEFEPRNVDISVFSEYHESLHAFESFLACGDSHVDETLRIVLRLNHEDTVSRRSDVTGKHCDVANKFCAVNRQEILLVNDHCLLSPKVSICNSPSFLGNLNACKGCCKFIVACYLLSLAAVDDRLCDFLEESQVVFAVANSNHICPCFSSLFHLEGNNSGIAFFKAYSQDHIGGKKLVDGVRGSVKAKNLRKSVCTVVHAKNLCSHNLCHLLHSVCFFVCISVGNCNRDGVLSVFCADALHSLSYENRHLVIIGFSESAIFLYQRIFDLAFQYGAVKSPFTLAAKKSFVYNALLIRVCLDEEIAIGFQLQGAANGAIGASGFRNIGSQRSFLDHGSLFLERAGRTYAYALTAGNTAGFDERFFHVRLNNRVEASVNKTQSANAHNLVADSYAKSAKDTLVRISYDERVSVLVFDGILVPCESFRVHFVLVRKVDELTFKVVVAAAFKAS